MTAGEQLPSQEIPYTWDEMDGPSTEVLQLWTEVGNGLDKSQTVVWKSAVESLDHSLKLLRTSQDARRFIEKYMVQIIGILIEQQPAKIGGHERNCVQESLALGVAIVAKDLEIQLERNGECLLLNSLTHIFNRKKLFYKGNKGNWSVNHLVGMPEVRLRNIERFRGEGGFRLLHRYLLQRLSTPAFPKLDQMHQILQALCDILPTRATPPEQGTVVREMEDDAINVAKAVMLYIESVSDEALKKLPTDQLNVVQQDLQKIFDKLVVTRRSSTYEFYQFWRSLVLKLITAQSLPLKLFGWEQVGELIDACADHRPPPRAFVVKDAGCHFANGIYEYAGEVTPDGYARPSSDVSYVHKIPDSVPEVGGKRLTLFRCTMRSQQKWWFLSEADEEQPGTDRDVDYYQHKSKEHEECFPPPAGWITCRNAGIDPPPTLESKGVLVPEGAEFDTLEHQLAKWAIENEIVEQVLGDTTIHREVVARSTVLIKFLAAMCSRDQPTEISVDGRGPNKYCLQASHLLFAWKTSTRKADAAVAHQVYQLLVSILPLCPSSLAIPLLKAVQTSLNESQEKRDYLFEVSEFCSALAAANVVDNKGVLGSTLTEEVREEVLNLLWSVLTHKGASSLKSYDSLKRYVTYELRVDARGNAHRDRFLRSCIVVLSATAFTLQGTSVDELQALRMVKLTQFVLEACPKEQAHKIVITDNGALPKLLFRELVAYLERRKSNGGTSNFGRNVLPLQSQTPITDVKLHSEALTERLRILRYVYGLADALAEEVNSTTMSKDMIEILWKLCDAPDDLEALMVFIASASHAGKVTQYDQLAATTGSMASQVSEHLLSSAFTEETTHDIFIDLFCAQAFNFDQMGLSSYRSFQYLFAKLNESPSSSSKKTALDALWRLCLSVEKASVASLAMKELLSVYIRPERRLLAIGQPTPRGQRMATDESDESFGRRIFECLERVQSDLAAKRRSAERSAERCLLILNSAIGQGGEGSITASTLSRLAGLAPHASLEEAMQSIPHGMRGQACCRRIGIIARRTQIQNQPSPSVDGRPNAPRPPATSKFTLDVHPLETLASLKQKVAVNCQCLTTAVKALQINGRMTGTSSQIGPTGPATALNLGVVPEDSVMDELGVVEGCEFVFAITEQRPAQNNSSAVPLSRAARNSHFDDLSHFFFSNERKFADRLFIMLLEILQALPWKSAATLSDGVNDAMQIDAHKLAWDFLLALPTNSTIVERMKAAQARVEDEPSVASSEDAMEVDAQRETWSQLLDVANFDRSVYILLTIDAFLQPAPEALSILNAQQKSALGSWMAEEAKEFRRAFIDAGGFGAVVRFFSASGSRETAGQTKTRRGNAVALRILKVCLFGNPLDGSEADLDSSGNQLMRSLSNTEGLLQSLTAMVVDDAGVSSATIMDILKFLQLLFRSQQAARSFVSLPSAEKFLAILLMWDEGVGTVRTSSAISAAMHVRKTAHDLILLTPLLADRALPWLMNAIDKADSAWESTSDYFDVLEKLVSDDKSCNRTRPALDTELRDLGEIVCRKLAASPRPVPETDSIDFSTGVLCGCLKLLRALIEKGGGTVLRPGANVLLSELKVENRWSTAINTGGSPTRGVLSIVSSPFASRPKADDAALVDIMGVIFDYFLTPHGSSVVAICCDKESRRGGFDVVGACARFCKGGEGYLALVGRIRNLIASVAHKLRHRWGQFGGSGDSHSRGAMSSKYSGLRNQGCTCYMNSFLQQLFMMPELRQSLCCAPIPASLRSSGSGTTGHGPELVGKKIGLQWDTGVTYDAVVESFDQATGMHTLRYCPIQVAAVSGSVHHQVQPEDVARLPPSLTDEFVLSEGRPCKETGVYEIINEPTDMETDGAPSTDSGPISGIKETEDEAASRHLLEEVQRTFIHLKEGSRGRCFDPRALVEACACLKLEFDVWQQNDASEFATKLLDRLEISLKKWAPSHFRYVDHTFGLKQTTQKICKECGLKTNREEKLLSIDCQIRGKSDIHEALAAMTEAQIMEGSNKVNCDRCKTKTDTIIRTAISTLPNLLILSLKRFDLDFTTFETVKLNNRCAFGQTLNMKTYTLEGLEAMEDSHRDHDDGEPSPMQTEESLANGDSETIRIGMVDEDYEYRLAGVLVHAGVAQGGHYYSFIKDRNSGSEDKWYRFDDEDVTPFDPSLIESECFGGKVKKETKWPNGTIHTVEQEQFANALMLFYEKEKPSPQPRNEPSEKNDEKSELELPLDRQVVTTTGYDVFGPDVLSSNATHRSQSFLFDSELLSFLKGLLGICRISLGNQEPSTSRHLEESWRESVIEMLMCFVFDVMLYSSEIGPLSDWSRMLEEILLLDRRSAASFVANLARKTREVSSNWLRTFLVECPDHGIRSACVRIFSAAIRSCTSSEEEVKALNLWAQAWRDQVASCHAGSLMPCSLDGKWHVLEDVTKLATGGASSVGIILSFINVLLEALPRFWRFSSEFCLFIRYLACMPFENGSNILREPMVNCLIPARLIAIAVRERMPIAIRASFPGSSASVDVAQSQVRAESNPHAHVMPLSSNQVNASDMNNSRGPVASDYLILMEAVGSLAGLPGPIHAALIQDSDDVMRGRQRYVLSEPAVKALSTVFRECRAPDAPGMGQREIEVYLQRSMIEAGTAPAQKVIDLMAKYPTTNSVANNISKGGSYLSLDGFLAYYRDAVQSSDVRLRLDLHTYGFRPNLTRRSRDARYVVLGDREALRHSAESVAVDVAESYRERSLDLGHHATLALTAGGHIFTVAYNVSEPLMQYLVAAATYRKDCETLITRTLLSIYQTPNDWSGNDNVTGCTMILQVIAATPGDDQQARIGKIMLSTTKAPRVDYGLGLLHVLQVVHGVRQSPQHFSSEVHWTFARYISVLKDLQNITEIKRWMNDNRGSWAFIERELDSAPPVGPSQNTIRADYAADSLPVDHNTQSDSDMAGMNDSEDDDEDSQFDTLIANPSNSGTANSGPFQVVVKGAGCGSVNGTYSQDGYFEGACRYVMDGHWHGENYKFYIFQCNVSNNTKHWYISIVPYGGNPGTSADIDFYTAPMTAECKLIPPLKDWIKAKDGVDPLPVLEHRKRERIWNGPVVEDDPEENESPSRTYI